MKPKVTIRVAPGVEGNALLQASGEGSLPEVKKGDPNGLRAIPDKWDTFSESCIYCGSTEQLSSEHIVPYSLGGRLQIHRGSCETCRKTTEKFENTILRGEMMDVRAALGLPSRSGHGASSKTIPVIITGSEAKTQAEIAIDESPILHSFFRFGRPGELTGTRGKGIAVTGLVSFNFGADIEEFMKSRGASEAAFVRSTPLMAVAFAQMLGKIAYGFAWLTGSGEYIDDMSLLADTVLNNPNDIGGFVGCGTSDLIKYSGVQHRLQFAWSPPNYICLDVQLFADAGTPTYVVVLGKSDARRWRKLRAHFERSFPASPRRAG